MTETYDIVVVGGGTAGCFAAATAADEGVDVALLERKPEEEAGHIACGDAIKGKNTFPDVIDREYLKEESFQNRNIQRAVFENPHSGDDIDIPLPGKGAVLDRTRYGEVLLEEADRLGADIEYDTVVQDVVQDADERSSSSPHSTSSHEDAAGTSSGEPSLADAREDADERSSSSPDSQTRQDDDAGRVTGVRAKRKGETLTYEADVVIDGAGALSLLQDKADLDDATFDTNVDYSQFCSAYREIVHVEDPVEWDDAIVFKPTEELGYLWYFPRSETEINAGLGFQMNKDPMELVDVLKRDLENREEFDGAEVSDKLGAALPTRRPYDSATGPGYVAVGDAAGHVNPTTGGGIPGAAKAGHWAAQQAIEAIGKDDVGEANLWKYNQRVMQDFGKRFAAMDLYNIFGSAHDVEELVAVVSSLPGQQLVDALGSKGTSSMSLGLKLKTIVKTFGHWETLYELYKVHKCAEDLKEVYDEYPSSPDEFADWRSRRDSIMDDVYEITGAEPKY